MEKATQKSSQHSKRSVFFFFSFFLMQSPSLFSRRQPSSHAFSLSLSLSLNNDSRCLEPGLAQADGRAKARPAGPDDDGIVRVVDDRDAGEGRGSGSGAMAALGGRGRSSSSIGACGST